MRKWLLFGSVIVVILLAASLIGSLPKTRFPADEYFEATFVNYLGFIENPNASEPTLELSMVFFYLTPVMGDATSLTIPYPPGMASEPLEFGTVKNGTRIQVEMPFQTLPVYLHPKNGIYPLELTIACHEAHGSITINIIPK